MSSRQRGLITILAGGPKTNVTDYEVLGAVIYHKLMFSTNRGGGDLWRRLTQCCFGPVRF